MSMPALSLSYAPLPSPWNSPTASWRKPACCPRLLQRLLGPAVAQGCKANQRRGPAVGGAPQSRAVGRAVSWAVQGLHPRLPDTNLSFCFTWPLRHSLHFPVRGYPFPPSHSGADGAGVLLCLSARIPWRFQRARPGRCDYRGLSAPSAPAACDAESRGAGPGPA